LQALDRVDSATTADIVAWLPPPQPAAPGPASTQARPTLRCMWVIDASSGRPVCSWVAE
jgi:hypothetical protein